MPQISNNIIIIITMADNIIGRNLRALRTANHFTQEQVAEFLGISSSQYQFFESGQRTAKLSCLEKLCNLFGSELSMLYSEDEEIRRNMLVCAFRVDGLSSSDLEQVASFKEIVMNDLKLNRIVAQ